MDKRKIARELARVHLKQQDPTGWFEVLYASANGDAGQIPWADLRPNPYLVAWLNGRPRVGTGKKALKVACGLGDDAEELCRQGFDVVAFDISATAVKWCTDRFPDSRVHYTVCDLFGPPPAWFGRFELVAEINTLQVLPPELRPAAMSMIARFIAPGGSLIVICRGRDPHEDQGQMPWPILQAELKRFSDGGLDEIAFEDFSDDEIPPTRRFRAEYRRPRHPRDPETLSFGNPPRSTDPGTTR